MSKRLDEHEAFYVREFLEENWSDFVEKLAGNYDDDAEKVAEEIVHKLA